MTPSDAPLEDVDVLVVGAGLSGIGAACQLVTRHPGKSVAVLEARATSGGTWDLFRYPGIRSDSDMFTFGFRWRPWPSDTALADGHLILDYLRTVAREHDVERLIRYDHRVTEASWSSAEQRWTVTYTHDGVEKQIRCGLLWGCSGYYDYEQGHAPVFPGAEDFEGEIVHPQFWPEDLDYAGKKVVVIGSGATAVTLVPAMAPTAGHVTMLQRSPTYVLSRPGRDPWGKALARVPQKLRFPLVRWKNILVQVGSYQLFQRRPEWGRRLIRTATEQQLQGTGLDVDTHFKPDYDPWDQRLCFVPDSDLFKALRSGKADVVTEHIDTFDATGIRLRSGEHLDADVIVTATGLKLKAFGGITMTVDGAEVKAHETMAYKALMLSGVPNFVFTIGYTNASWTLKADLVSDYVCRMLSYLDEHGRTSFTAQRDPEVGERPFMDFRSGYVLRALDHLPRQGDRAPWMLKQNYLTDLRTIRHDDLDDGVLAFR
ncbi:NAD(P)/FAD-dependent oxidoreductase [Nocardioides sp. GY 10127]|uniref:flavin-containing monooxygenase n=1 Tax=Nocardioides sp. GY 10127 TaxID=2569762 RepID=UPI0010A914EB|nr:NAD(P)/FAD-dependent oxidoreductase [Nocardioides sp. GY 10127]TIC82861.1 NAD(P)/FAD-dependent oxidoreductase [Nocardioides sp. GY 10127]